MNWRLGVAVACGAVAAVLVAGMVMFALGEPVDDGDVADWRRALDLWWTQYGEKGDKGPDVFPGSAELVQASRATSQRSGLPGDWQRWGLSERTQFRSWVQSQEG